MEQPNTTTPQNNKWASPFKQTFFHGTKESLNMGDFVEAGQPSYFGKQNNAKFIYLTATLDAAIWGAELAGEEGLERIY